MNQPRAANLAQAILDFHGRAGVALGIAVGTLFPVPDVYVIAGGVLVLAMILYRRARWKYTQ